MAHLFACGRQSQSPTHLQRAKPHARREVRREKVSQCQNHFGGLLLGRTRGRSPSTCSTRPTCCGDLVMRAVAVVRQQLMPEFTEAQAACP